MKIAYIINSLECGGAQLPIPNIVSLIRARGGDVTVFGLEKRNGLAIPHLERHHIPYRVRTGSLKDHFSALQWLKHELKEFQPDLIWTSLTRAALLGQIVANKMNLPIVHWQHSARLKPSNALLLKLLCKRTALWIADSPSVEDFTRKALNLKNNLTYWPIFRADPSAPIAKPYNDQEPIRIGSLGRLHPVKGYDILCEAIHLLKDHPNLPKFELLFAGDGPEREKLEKIVSEKKLPVQFVGHCDEPFSFLSSLHLYVQPSHWEGMCVAAHEAMSCALPIIATPAGEIPQTVDDGRSGIIVPFNNAPALAAALAKLLQTPEKLQLMGRQSRQRVFKRFGPEAFIKHGHEAINQIPGFNVLKDDASYSSSPVLDQSQSA
ncbi:glycosyltransferase [Swingsia samuiensis]|uniref:Glycosyltransferase n=1 Tax=Swingsia samuiensis TaxID=1293412 RepID=A0A4Y6ULQ3_9PROT|nr:glycosyltransferase [Swingsia samuiensis]QDH17710.1 glycosyltransferase [Swingsia samuiensis]